MPIPWNSETAKAASAKGLAARANRRAELKAAETTLKSLLPSLAKTIGVKPEPVNNPQNDQIDTYQADRVKRVREQVEVVSKRLDDALEADELDAGAIDRLANALTRMQEIERVMSGRPLPGSKRPAAEKPKRNQGQSFEPVE